MSRGSARRRSPDISFTATVRAERIRWNEDPETQVSFTGSPGYESVSESDRVSLSDRVRARVTYRDIRVDYRLECVLPDQPERPDQEQ
jgi:hypothetical protein